MQTKACVMVRGVFEFIATAPSFAVFKETSTNPEEPHLRLPPWSLPLLKYTDPPVPHLGLIIFCFPFFCCSSLTVPNTVGRDARWCTPLHWLPSVPQQRVDSFTRQSIGFYRLPSHVLNHSRKKLLRVPVFGVLFAALFFTLLLRASRRRPFRFDLVSQEH